MTYVLMLEALQPYSYKQEMDGIGYAHKVNVQNVTMMLGCTVEYRTILRSNGYSPEQLGLTGIEKGSRTSLVYHQDQFPQGDPQYQTGTNGENVNHTIHESQY